MFQTCPNIEVSVIQGLGWIMQQLVVQVMCCDWGLEYLSYDLNNELLLGIWISNK